MLETQFQSYTTKDGNVIQSIHPPEVVLDIKGAIAAPYKLEHKGTDSVSNHKDIGQLIQQNNYTNLYLHSIGKQTTRIEGLLNKDKIQHIQPNELKLNPAPSSGLLFKPNPIIDPNVFRLFNPDNSFVDALVEKLGKLSLSASGPSKASKQSKERINVLSKHEEYSDIDIGLEEIFHSSNSGNINNNSDDINKISFGKNKYTPTVPTRNY